MGKVHHHANAIMATRDSFAKSVRALHMQVISNIQYSNYSNRLVHHAIVPRETNEQSDQSCMARGMSAQWKLYQHPRRRGQVYLHSQLWIFWHTLQRWFVYPSSFTKHYVLMSMFQLREF